MQRRFAALHREQMCLQLGILKNNAALHVFAAKGVMMNLVFPHCKAFTTTLALWSKFELLIDPYSKNQHV